MRRRRADNIGVLLRRIKREDVERAQVLRSRKALRRIRSSKARFTSCRKKRGAAYPVLQWVSSAVLFPDDRRDWLDGFTGGRGDGDAAGR